MSEPQFGDVLRWNGENIPGRIVHVMFIARVETPGYGPRQWFGVAVDPGTKGGEAGGSRPHDNWVQYDDPDWEPLDE